MGGFINTRAQSPGQRPGGTATVTTTAASGTVESHLDSLFEASGWTREDILVIAASAQIIMWFALLYLEVSE